MATLEPLIDEMELEDEKLTPPLAGSSGTENLELGRGNCEESRNGCKSDRKTSNHGSEGLRKEKRRTLRRSKKLQDERSLCLACVIRLSFRHSTCDRDRLPALSRSFLTFTSLHIDIDRLEARPKRSRFKKSSVKITAAVVQQR